MQIMLPRAAHALRGFSLVELLVAIVITVLLLVLAVPVGSSIAASASSARCVSHLRENGTILHASANDHRGSIPLYFYDLPGSSRTWADFLKDADYITQNSNIQLCPGASPKKYTARGNIYGVALPTQAQVLESEHYARLQGVLYIRLAALSNPSQCWLLTDSWLQSQNKQFYVISDSQGSVHFRHRQKANFLFADGHVRSLSPAATRDLAHFPLRKGYNANGQLFSY